MKTDSRTPHKISISCYVCNQRIKCDPVYIAMGLFRHERCCPGSIKWLKSPVGRRSVLPKYFDKE
jgi:hypothetical protein